MMDNERLAELLFADVDKTPEEIEQQYPLRALSEGVRVTRFAPSPTGFLHIGGLYAALIAKRVAGQDGVFYLRIEDTDQKREVSGGIELIVDGLRTFGIHFDEGMTGSDSQSGHYGPYRQSKRKEIYQVFAKWLVQKGLAYPCFCTAEQLDQSRQQQQELKLTPGYYGKFARCRSLTLEQIEQKIAAGLPYVVRLKSQCAEGRLCFDDAVKGKIEMPRNNQDIVLLKTDGIPTYHFAHAVDDHLMRTTTVVRGDEWISSVPIHLELFYLLGFKPPKYAHIAPIMKEEDGAKRKLSKRKDPEAAVDYYELQGYPAESVLEYLMTIASSAFEDWRRANPEAELLAFPFNLKKMSQSGALFDLQKLDDVSKNVIAGMTAEQVYEKALAWASRHDQELYELFCERPDYAKAILAIDRGGKKPRKDIAKWSDLRQYVAYFYPQLEDVQFICPEHIAAQDAKAILAAYCAIYDPQDDKETWFNKIKEICLPLGFTPNVKEYKQNPGQFKGHVGDVSSVIRLAVTGRANTPDLCSIMALMGELVDERLASAQNRI